MTWVWVAVAGAVGALIRHGAVTLAIRVAADARYGTTTVNVVGAAALGSVVRLFRDDIISEPSALIIGVGFCGALTTFSTWMLESVEKDDAVSWQRMLVPAVFGLVASGVGWFVAGL